MKMEMKQSPIEEIITLANRGKTASIAQVVAAQEQLATLKAERDEAMKFLSQYLSNYDDPVLSNEDMKNWLDEYWLPNIRLIVKVQS